MICPSCGHRNIPGADVCENCQGDLTAFDQPAGGSAIESSIMTEGVAALEPRIPVMVSPQTTVAEAVLELNDREIGCLLVGTAEKLVGIFTERDVLLRIAHDYERWASEPVSEYMTHNPETLEATAPIAYALNRMSIGGFRHLPITREGQLVGIISLRDILGYLSRWYPDLLPPRATP